METEIVDAAIVISNTIIAKGYGAALTGAGISKESGIPTFRDKDGLWSKFKPEEFATPEALFKHPKKVWEWYKGRYFDVLKAKPNKGHLALAELGSLLKLFFVITQNIDRLHQRAGSRNVIELHGNLFQAKCVDCGTIYPMDEAVKQDKMPPKCKRCGGMLRPNVVLFGEPLPEDALDTAIEMASRSYFFLVVGTSASVYPAASLPLIAKRNASVIIEVNPEPTPVTKIADISIRGKAGEILPKLVHEVKKLLREDLEENEEENKKEDE